MFLSFLSASKNTLNSNMQSVSGINNHILRYTILITNNIAGEITFTNKKIRKKQARTQNNRNLNIPCIYN